MYNSNFTKIGYRDLYMASIGAAIATGGALLEARGVCRTSGKRDCHIVLRLLSLDTRPLTS